MVDYDQRIVKRVQRGLWAPPFYLAIMCIPCVGWRRKFYQERGISFAPLWGSCFVTLWGSRGHEHIGKNCRVFRDNLRTRQDIQFWPHILYIYFSRWSLLSPFNSSSCETMLFEWWSIAGFSSLMLSVSTRSWKYGIVAATFTHCHGFQADVSAKIKSISSKDLPLVSGYRK